MDAHTSAMECNSTKQAPHCDSRKRQYTEVKKREHAWQIQGGRGGLTIWSRGRREAANNPFQHTCPDNELIVSTWNSGKAEGCLSCKAGIELTS